MPAPWPCSPRMGSALYLELFFLESLVGCVHDGVHRMQGGKKYQKGKQILASQIEDEVSIRAQSARR